MRRSLLILTALILTCTLALMLLRYLLAAVFPSSVVAYMTLARGLPEVVVHDLSHNLKERLDFAYLTEPSFSPAGARLALTQLLRFGSDIVTYDLTSGASTKLTDSNAIAEAPAWSPDGEWIAFASNQEGDNNIYIVKPDGSDRRRVTAHKAGDRQPAWSPDSQTIAFTSNRGDGWDLYSIHLPTGALRQLTAHPAPDTSPDWSPASAPNSERIVFASGRDGASSIYLLTLETGTVEPLVLDSRYDSLPRWTPAGRTVTFARSVDGESRIMRVDVATGELSQLELGEPNADGLAWWRGGD